MTLTPETATARTLWAARFSTIGLFLITGMGMGVWVVSIPAIRERTDVDHAVLGTLLLFLGAGALVGMQTAGALVDRHGSRRIAVVSGVILAAGVLAPIFAYDAPTLGVSLFLLGLGQGATDVSMNDQAVIIEREWGKPIMSSFHAFFSIGGGIGAIVGSVVQSLQQPHEIALVIGAATALVVVLACAPALRSETSDTAIRADDAPFVDASAVKPAGYRSMIVLMGLVAFALMLAEGTAADWSAVHAVDIIGVSPAAAGLAYAVFATTMTIGRFVTDPLVQRFGPVWIVRWGSAIGAFGLLLVVLSPWYPLTLAGWLIVGAGLSGTIPQIFTAAGNIPGAPRGATIARVVGAGYIGLMAGPAVIGWLSAAFGLPVALSFGVVCCALGAVLARRVTARTN